VAEPSMRDNTTQKLNEILRRLEGSPEESLRNIEVLNEKILDDVKDIKGRVKSLEISVIIGNGELPLKEQVHGLQRDVQANTTSLNHHIAEDKKRDEKLSTNWEKLGFEFLRILPGLILAYLLVTFGWK